MKKRLLVILLLITLVVPCLGTVSASCPACGGPSTLSCSGWQSNYWLHGCGSGIAYYMYTWVECASYPEHTIISGEHFCYCSECFESDCPSRYCPY